MTIFKKRDYKETLIRSIVGLLFVGLILGLSMRKILVAFGINKADPLVSMNIINLPSIPVWSSYVCGINFNKVTAQTLKRGPPGTSTDHSEDLPQDYIQSTTTDSLIAGDWTAERGRWPCFVFNPKDISFKPGEVDAIILLIFADVVTDSPNGMLFGIFDEERNMSSVEPFVTPTPSLNTYTFTRSERLDVNEKLHSYFTVNKQNFIKVAFQAPGLAARFVYSPDTYSVVKYTEKIPYTPYDLISAVGGLITYALGAWFILFGRGKYRSWGLVQRYLLHSSPDARKKNDDQLLPSFKTSNETTNEMENKSQTVVNDDDKSSIYYFSMTGTPTQANYNPTSFSPSPTLHSVKDLNRRIDAKIDQKLWSVEQTLSRHYLSGFKIRKYDVDLKKFGFDPNDDNKEVLTPPTARHNWNNLDSGRTLGDHYNIKRFQSSSSLSSNPEEQRPQYPNVPISQVPLEKKQRGKNSGSGNYQQFVNTGEIINDDNVGGTNIYNPNVSASSSYSPSSVQIFPNPQMSQSDNRTDNSMQSPPVYYEKQ